MRLRDRIQSAIWLRESERVSTNPSRLCGHYESCFEAGQDYGHLSGCICKHSLEIPDPITGKSLHTYCGKNYEKTRYYSSPDKYARLTGKPFPDDVAPKESLSELDTTHLHELLNAQFALDEFMSQVKSLELIARTDKTIELESIGDKNFEAAIKGNFEKIMQITCEARKNVTDAMVVVSTELLKIQSNCKHTWIYVARNASGVKRYRCSECHKIEYDIKEEEF